MTIIAPRIIVNKEIAERFAALCKAKNQDPNKLIEGYMANYIKTYKDV